MLSVDDGVRLYFREITTYGPKLDICEGPKGPWCSSSLSDSTVAPESNMMAVLLKRRGAQAGSKRCSWRRGRERSREEVGEVRRVAGRSGGFGGEKGRGSVCRGGVGQAGIRCERGCERCLPRERRQL
eukprot:2846642-Rhodomonas_salina.1